MPKRKIVIGAAIAVVAIAVVVMSLYFQRERGPSVQVEAMEHRDLEAVVSASGRIQPKRSVNISADTIGRVTRLAVEEGETVEAGQFLLQIDPELHASAVERGEAGLSAARESVNQTRVSVEAARANLELAQQNVERKRELFHDELMPRELLDQAESELKVRESELKVRETEVLAQEQRLKQEIASLRSARYTLSKVTIEAPMDGLITRLNIEEGETVLVGTMNNAGTVLITVADMSVIQAEIEVDETDIVDVRIGQPAVVIIDAFPDQEFKGIVSKIGSSSMQAVNAATQQATNFAVEVILEEEIPGARPGFSATADITTATRVQALAVPIQALTVREITRDETDQIVRDKEKDGRKSDADLPPGMTREEEEGVFVVQGRVAEFTPIEVGIAGERYFEVLSGLEAGDEVITGPFSSVRELSDGDTVKVEEPE